MFEDAIAAVPQVIQVRQARERLQAHYDAQARPAVASGQVVADEERRLAGQVQAAALAGGQLPDVDELRGQVAELRRYDAQAHSGALHVLRAAVSGLDSAERVAIRRHAADALPWLAGRLAEIVARAREVVDELGDVRLLGAEVVQGGVLRQVRQRPGRWVAAGDATAGQREAWWRLTELAAQYRSLREAQCEVVRLVAVDSAGRLPVAGEFRDLAQVWPDWTTDELAPGVVPPWGAEVRRWTAAGPEFLAWLGAATDVEVWVPSVDELAAAYEQLTGGARPVSVIERAGDNAGGLDLLALPTSVIRQMAGR